MKVTVLGSGAWGTALALLLLENGNQVAMWSHHPAALHEIRTQGENPKLPGVPVPERLELAEDMSCAAESDVVVLATPSFAMRETAAKLNQVVRPGTILVSVGKGIEKNTSLRMSEVIQSEIQAECPLVVLCGPTHAEEVGRRIPSGIVAASQDREAAEQVQDLFMNSRFRVYTSSDVIGVEISAAMKNVIALCAGISDGVGYGDNTRAMLITRGLTEIARLGVAQGGNQATFAGLAGVGDLIVTCTSGRDYDWPGHGAPAGAEESGGGGGGLLRCGHRERTGQPAGGGDAHYRGSLCSAVPGKIGTGCLL